MVPFEGSLLFARQGVLPVFRRRPLGGRLVWLLTFNVSAAMFCLAFVVFAQELSLGV